jgi:predicted dehydrogenase
MAEIVKWGIIGCGDVAEIKSGPAFQKADNSKLLAVMRRNSDLAKDFAKRNNVPLWYTDAQNLLDNPEINAVYIATPPSTHLQYALQALDAGKNVYIEKPMVMSSLEANQLQKSATHSNSKLVVAHYRRFLPLYIKVNELLENSTIGQVRYIDLKFLQTHDFNNNADWRLDKEISGGGYFHDIAPHQLDLIYHFFGDFIEAIGFGINQSKIYEVDDTVTGLINFKNKVQFRGIWSFTMPKDLTEDSCTIYGEEGTISFSFYKDELTVNKNNHSQTEQFKNPENIQLPLINETVKYFLGQRNNPCSVDDGVKVISIMEKFTDNKYLQHGANLAMVRA